MFKKKYINKYLYNHVTKVSSEGCRINLKLRLVLGVYELLTEEAIL